MKMCMMDLEDTLKVWSVGEFLITEAARICLYCPSLKKCLPEKENNLHKF